MEATNNTIDVAGLWKDLTTGQLTREGAVDLLKTVLTFVTVVGSILITVGAICAGGRGESGTDASAPDSASTDAIYDQYNTPPVDVQVQLAALEDSLYEDLGAWRRQIGASELNPDPNLRRDADIQATASAVNGQPTALKGNTGTLIMSQEYTEDGAWAVAERIAHSPAWINVIQSQEYTAVGVSVKYSNTADRGKLMWVAIQLG